MDYDPTMGPGPKPDNLDEPPSTDEHLVPPHESLSDYEVIYEELWKETYFDYAVAPTVIAEEDVYYKVREGDAFQAVKQKIGWPNFKDDGGVDLPRAFTDDGEPNYEDFTLAFISMAGNDANLANFRLWLAADLNEKPYDEASGIDIWGSHPALHRLYALMPEFMGAVHRRIKDAYDLDKSGEADFAMEMTKGESEVVMKATYLIYQIAGRILKADDNRRHEFILTGQDNPTAAKIVDAHQALRA